MIEPARRGGPEVEVARVRRGQAPGDRASACVQVRRGAAAPRRAPGRPGREDPAASPPRPHGPGRRRRGVGPLLALAAALLQGCVVRELADPAAEVREEAEVGHVESGTRAVVSWLPHATSPDDDDCGPSALTTVLGAAGVRKDLAEVREEVVDHARGGAPASALVRYARDQGTFALVREKWYLDDLKAWVRADVAPILALWAGPGALHFVLMTGYDDARRVVLLRDQEGVELALSYDQFFPRWCEAQAWALVVCSPSIILPEDQARLDARELGALGWLAEKHGDLDAARRHYQASLERDPDYEAVQRNLRLVEQKLASTREPPDSGP